MKIPRLVVLGGGFAGVKCAQTLRRLLPSGTVEIVLFSAENHLVFTPLLADVVGASVNPLDVVVPLRQLLVGVACRTEEVLRLDLDGGAIEYRSSDGYPCRLTYDHLVLACGSVSNLQAVPGMADHAFPLRTMGDAILLRSQVMEQMERAETCSDPARRAWYLSFVVVGAGFSGVEAAGEINDLVRGSARYFQNFSAADVRVTLIQSRDRILPEISPRLAAFARQKLERSGVQVLVETRVVEATADGVALVGAGFVRGGTVVCTVGSSPAPLLEALTTAKVRGRLATEADLRLAGRTHVWAIGDCAHILNAHDAQPAAPTGQFAERQGEQCARNIARVLRGEPTRPFRFKPLGQLCSVGGHAGVAEFLGWRIAGFPAWFLWRGVYLFKLPSWARRLQVAFDWSWQLMFPRDLAHVRTRLTDRVTHARYQAGDLILRSGEPSTRLFVVEEGEVQLVRAGEGGGDSELLGILGPGACFGEEALLGEAPATYSVQARTSTRVLVLGRNVFTQISASLAPVRDLVAEALNRRRLRWAKVHPRAHEALKGVAVRDLMDREPGPVVGPDATLSDVGQVFAKDPHEVLYVCTPERELLGIVTMTDWMRAVASGAAPATPVTEIAVLRPVTVTIEDDGLTAASVVREHRLKHLPVVNARPGRKLVGTLHTRRLMAHVFGRVGAA